MSKQYQQDFFKKYILYSLWVAKSCFWKWSFILSKKWIHFWPKSHSFYSTSKNVCGLISMTLKTCNKLNNVKTGIHNSYIACFLIALAFLHPFGLYKEGQCQCKSQSSSDFTLPTVLHVTAEEELQPNLTWTTTGISQGSSHLNMPNPIPLVLL